MHSHTRGRRTALTILAVLALITLAACSSKDDDVSTGSGDDSTAANADDVLGEPNAATGTPITIGFVTDGANASFGSDEDRIATYDATVKYVNEYLGGVNGHPLEVEHCSTDATPAGATQCAVELTSAAVDAMVVPVSAQDGALFDGMAGSGIPYFTYTSAASKIITSPGAFVMSNPISQIATPGLIAQEKKIDKAGFIIIDVPAATGPVSALAKPIYAGLGVELQIVPISPSVADMTPQLQEAIGGEAGIFAISGTDDFNISAVNGLLQLGFEGPIILTDPSEKIVDALTSVESVIGSGIQTNDPADADVQLMNAVTEKYTDLDPADVDELAFANVLGFARALTGATDAVDAATITAALSAMPESELPLGGGITFQCGTAPVSFAPNICSLDVLSWTYDADGQRQDFGIVDVPAEALKLG